MVGVENGRLGVQNRWLVYKTGGWCQKQILLYAGHIVVAMVLSSWLVVVIVVVACHRHCKLQIKMTPGGGPSLV